MGIADAWIGNAFPLSAWTGDVDLAYDAARLIAEKPTSIDVRRGASTLEAQTVRIEEYRGNRTVVTNDNRVAQVAAMLLGYKSHPTIAATDVQVGDRFDGYEVREIVPNTIDSLQAYLIHRS